MRERNFRPLIALRAWRRLRQDPDDTAAVFEILDALRGRSGERMFVRFAASGVGKRVLREQQALAAPRALAPDFFYSRRLCYFTIRK